MKIRKLPKIKPGRVGIYVFLIALVAFTAMPLIYLVSSAFKPLYEIYAFPPKYFVENPTLGNFTQLLSAMGSSSVPFSRYFFNSFLVTIMVVVLAIFVCSMAAYAMTKCRLPAKRGWFNFIVAAMMFSAPATQIASYLIINKLGLVNTYFALVLPAVATPMYLFLMKQNVELIPDAIIESARMDGCTTFRIYRSMIMPLSKPVIATVVVFAFNASWNDAYGPMLYINVDAMKTLPLALSMLQGGVGTVARSGAMMAASLLTTIPVIVVFVFMQSKVIKTMAHSGIK